MFQGAQPLEIDDFAGGITENYMQGDPRRSRYLDNMLITVDKSIQTRYGIVPLDNTNYVFPNSTGQRTSGLYFWMTEKILFGQTGRKIFVMDPQTTTWVEMSGLNSSDAMSGGDAHSQTSFAEFQKQVYLTDDGLDGNGTLPSKIYQDSSNVWRAKTAGLPRAYTSATYTASSLLAACIYNANALRASMIAHCQDAQNATYVTGVAGSDAGASLHVNVDKFSLSYLQAVTFTPTIIPANATGFDPEKPSPLPTPAPAATDQASLFTLLTALNAAFTHHVTEASNGSSLPIVQQTQSLNGISYTLKGAAFYHQRALVNNSANGTSAPPTGPHALLTANATPTTVAQVASMLDDMLQKWNWHRQAIWVHSVTNNADFMNKYAPLCTAIGSASLTNLTPVVTPDNSDIINYANNLSFLYNGHVLTNAILPIAGYEAHGQTNNGRYSLDLADRLTSATDLNSAYLKIYWLRCLYSLHTKDAAVAAHTGITFTYASGTPTSLTAIVNKSTGSAITIPVGSFITLPPSAGFTFTGASLTARVTASGSGTATVDFPMSGAGASLVGGQYSTSVYHLCDTAAGVPIDSTVSIELATDALTNPVNSIGVDTSSWMILASEFFYAMASHASLATIHRPDYTPANFTSYIGVTANPFYIPAAANVSYAFFFTDSYTVGQNGIQYLVRGNPVLSPSTQVAVSYPTNYTIVSPTPTIFPSVINTVTRANVLTNLPVLANQQNTNYDTTNVQLNIYRTINAGQTYFLVAQVPNGTTSYSDTTNDSIQSSAGATALINSQSMYTTGGTVGSDQPPVAKFIHIFSGSVYYAGITDSGQYFPQQLRQSVQFAPEWAPATFSDNLDDDITGISSTKSNVIAFCKNSTYRMSGGFSQTGQGAITHDRIADVIGSLNMKGIVKTEIGVFFPGNDGFYYTDGYQVIKISLELDRTYQALTLGTDQKRAISGCYDKSTRRIWWNMMAATGDADVSVSYIFYLDYGVKPSGVFSTASNFSNYAPASMVFSNGVQYIGHRDGYILKSDFNTKFDYTVSTSAASAWTGQYIPYNWTTVAIDLGTISKKKYLTTLNISGNNVGNVSAQPYVLRDLNKTGAGLVPLAPIRDTQNIVWGDARIIYGTASVIYKLDGLLDVFRRFPRKTLRSNYVQLSVQPSYGVIYSSYGDYPNDVTTLGQCYANVNASAKTATIALSGGDGTISALHWYPDVIGAFIYFQSDGYVQGFQILSLAFTNTQLTFSDPGSLFLVNKPNTQWVIRGYKLNQRMNITAAAIGFTQNASNTQVYPGASAALGVGNGGENPS